MSIFKRIFNRIGKTIHLKFNKESDEEWYIDIPHYPFAHHNLMMVAGADRLCEYVAVAEGHPNYAVVDVTVGDRLIDDRVPDIEVIRIKWGDGAHYRNKKADGSVPTVFRNGYECVITEAWICPVTLLVLLRYPKPINIYIVK